MLIQMHFLQNYAPSNLNRDQSGSPKDAIFGGHKRGRISSQCLKRNIRLSSVFEDEFKQEGLLGMRTQQLPALVRDALKRLDATEEEIATIVARVPEIGRESTKGKKDEDDENGMEADDAPEQFVTGETKQLIFLDTTIELPQFALKILAECRKHGVKTFGNSKKVKISEITKSLGSTAPRSVDIALFGRMTTSEAFKDVQAASQVAHAISTHKVEQEFDYYTAMDDLKPDGEPGADMIGDIEFNSCTYYRYLNVHWEGLLENLGGPEHTEIARRAVIALLRAATIAQPSGKQNTFAAFSLPDFILVEVSAKNLPISYANAFLKPARAIGEKTLMDVSIEQFADHVDRLSKTYGLKAERAYIAMSGNQFELAEAQNSLDDLQTWLQSLLPVQQEGER